MAGATWKTNVGHVGASLDRCRDHIDRLESINDVEEFRKEIFRNANTRVKVSIKTGKTSSERKEKNWSSLMSESSPEFQEARISRTRPAKKEINQFRGFPAKKLNAGTEGRHFAQATKSSKAKKLSKEMLAKGEAKSRHDSKKHEDVVDSVAPVDFIQHRFQSRTLNIFLKEMRSAIKNQNLSEANKVLDDLEYVAQNLQSPKHLKKEESKPAFERGEDGSKRHQMLSSKPSKEMSEDQKSQIYETTLLRSEAKRLNAENKELRRALDEMEHRLGDADVEVQRRDENNANLKLIISRLTSNNNDMLAILASKASVEDTFKKLESENVRLSHNLEATRQRNLQLENKVRQNESEANRMRKVISDLKSSLNRNLQEESLRKVSHGVTESTIDLELSSDAKSVDASDEDDSAIGEGISESHPISSAGANNPPPMTKPVQSTRTSYQSSGFHPLFSGAPQYSRTSRQSHAPPSQTSRTSGPPPVTTSTGNEVPSFVPFPVKLGHDDSQFKAAPLHLSVTNDSDASSSASERRSTVKSTERFSTPKSNLEEKEDEQEDEMERKHREEELAKKAALTSAAQMVDAKVQSFLERLRNDKKFQVSLSSEMMRTHENENSSGIGEISGLTTDLETTHGQSRQVEEDTIDLSQDQE